MISNKTLNNALGSNKVECTWLCVQESDLYNKRLHLYHCVYTQA